MVVVEPNQNALPQGTRGSFMGGVSTAASLVIGYMYKKGARYAYEGHTPYTINPMLKSRVRGTYRCYELLVLTTVMGSYAPVF